ncbi:hypothetical protein SCLCIDRAFT_1217515 [Scleroderma citrinum Foug A]|uniref:Uncharacterized protein n=1 Tax=Scleroderma citrinum Foug A TaxID=1036808 RepID=A0A0C3DGA8_9AGAM|nr:hypothetical protein SCLCIDRAFT_1217515 [Scleroderma citrinum Foug A]
MLLLRLHKTRGCMESRKEQLALEQHSHSMIATRVEDGCRAICVSNASPDIFAKTHSLERSYTEPSMTTSDS